MSYADELAEAGYRNFTGYPVYSVQLLGDPLCVASAIGKPPELYKRGTWYRSGKLQSIVLDCGTVLISGFHEISKPLGGAALRRFAPDGCQPLYLLPGLDRGDICLPDWALAKCQPFDATRREQDLDRRMVELRQIREIDNQIRDLRNRERMRELAAAKDSTAASERKPKKVRARHRGR